jgi:hypothetical protein
MDRSADPEIDLESQQLGNLSTEFGVFDDDLCPLPWLIPTRDGDGGNPTHETNSRQSEPEVVLNRASLASADGNIDIGAQPSTMLAPGDESVNVSSRRVSIQVETHTQVPGDTPHLGVYIPYHRCGLFFLMQCEWVGAGNPAVDHTTVGGTGSNQEPRVEHMIGDFDNSANALWTLYRNEAKSHDEACIRTLKDDMDGVLIFVRSYFFIV